MLRVDVPRCTPCETDRSDPAVVGTSLTAPFCRHTSTVFMPASLCFRIATQSAPFPRPSGRETLIHTVPFTGHRNPDHERNAQDQLHTMSPRSIYLIWIASTRVLTGVPGSWPIEFGMVLEISACKLPCCCTNCFAPDRPATIGIDSKSLIGRARSGLPGL